MSSHRLLVVSSAILMAAGSVTFAAPQDNSTPAQQSAVESNQDSVQSGAQQNNSRESAKEHSSRAERRGQQNAPEGFVLLDEKVVYIMASQPQQHFIQAHAKLARKDYRAAAEETRLAGAFLQMQESRAQGQAKEALSRQATNLSNFADEIEKNGNVSEAQLNQQFGEAERVLAEFHQKEAKADLHHQRYVKAGYDLSAAAHDLKAAYVWTGEKPTQDQVKTVADAQAVSLVLRNADLHKAASNSSNASGSEHEQANAQSNSKDHSAASNSQDKTQGNDEQAQLATAHQGNQQRPAQQVIDQAMQITNQLGKDISNLTDTSMQGKVTSPRHEQGDASKKESSSGNNQPEANHENANSHSNGSGQSGK